MGVTQGFLSAFIIASYFLISTAQRSDCQNENPPFDIVFLVDSSGSINMSDFQEIKVFLRSVVGGLDINTRNVQVGLVQFTNNVHKEFLLGEYANEEELVQKINKISHRTGRTYIGKALTFLKDNVFISAAGSRIEQKVPQIVMVFTDGKSNDITSGPAEDLRSKGVVVFAVGVGKTNLTTLRTIASRPVERFVVNVKSYQDLKDKIMTMMESVCILMSSKQKAIAPKFADVFVLVDSSAQNEKQKIRDLLTQLAEQLKVGEGSNKIALAQFGENVVKEFLFNDYKDTATAKKYILRFEPKPKGKRNLGKAMDYVRTHFFNTASGSRIAKGYKQYLMVLRIGKSSDSVLTATRALKSEDVTVIDVSLERKVMDLMPRLQAYAFDVKDSLTLATTLTKQIETKEVVSVTEECVSAQLADIVFIVDESGSIIEDDFAMMKLFLHRFISSLQVSLDSIRVGIVLYSDEPKPEFYLNSFETKDRLLEYITFLYNRGGGTLTGKAIQFVKNELFTSKRGSRKALGVKQIAVVITDGESQDDVTNAAAELRRLDVTMYSIGVRNASYAELKKMASYPEEQFVYNVKNFENLPSLEKSIRTSVCKTITNELYKKEIIHSIKQGCLNTEEADIYFLLDNSGSLQVEFEDVKKFILYLLQLFSIGAQQVRVGVVKVDGKSMLQFKLTDHTNKASLETAVKNIVQPTGGTGMGQTLTYVTGLFKDAEASRQVKVQTMLIVITDKKSQDDVSNAAADLRSLGVSVYAIGVKNADRGELLKMAGESKMFFSPNYDSLNTMKSIIVKDICSKEACRDQIADIMFLIDGSLSIADSDFLKMKTFINDLVNASVIGQDNVHIGVVQFSDDPREEFPLNRFYDKNSLWEAIKKIKQLDTNTYTGKALLFVSKYFDEASGGRPNIAQFLIVITDGEAHDAVAMPAKAIRDKGVTVYSIGVGGRINNTQLWEISGSNDKVYFEKDFDTLLTKVQEIKFKICNPVTECQKAQVADVIFLVQYTRQILSQDGEHIKNFISSVVNSTHIGENLIRIGIIVYSDTPYTTTLKQYMAKRQVLEAIKDLKFPPGNAFTAKALQYTFPFFNKENGGRRTRRIPQMLFVITDGAAADQNNLRAQAEEFAKEKIHVYGIGVANAQRSELEIITKKKKQVFQVENYDGLKNLQNNIAGILCNVTKPECLNDVADLVFLIDGPSIEEKAWATMISFLQQIVDKLRVGSELFQIGVAQFGNKFQNEFYLSAYNTSEEVKSAIRKIQKIKATEKNIGKGLHNVDGHFLESTGSRILEDVPQNLVVITDGHSNDDVTEHVKYLKDKKVNIYVIGVGKASIPHLNLIAGSQDRIFTVQTFNHSYLTIAIFISAVCRPEPYDQPSCSIDIAVGFDNSHTSSNSPSIFRDQNKLYSYLPDIIRYMSVVHNLCCITDPILKTNIGFRLVDANGKLINDYPFEEYDKELVKKVMELQTSQALKFNTNLLSSFKEMFKASKASVKVLIIFTDGLDEPVEDLLIATKELRSSGVQTLVTVALNGIRNSADLQRLEFGRGFRYNQPLSIDMRNVASVMQNEIDSIATWMCCKACKCTGEQGVHGPPGYPGNKGLPGPKGRPGFPGEEGLPGERGSQGFNGTHGHRGCQGKRGFKGGRGYGGEDGESGDDGLNGIDGEQGQTGVGGSPGERGDPGSPGPRGITGGPGSPGERGLRGDPGDSGLDNKVRGPKGEIGSPGIQGDPGPDGSPGQAGEQGRPGINGKRGAAGEMGLRGPPGQPGPQGPPGASGPSGALGPLGPAGQKGFPGLPGPQGTPGSPGRPGSKGSVGARGQKGQSGDPGNKGALGPLGPRGQPGKDGTDGYGVKGAKGQKGDIGHPGYPGLRGEYGDPGKNGGPGSKGNRGRGGNAGNKGSSGDPGRDGVPGHRGSKGEKGDRSMSDCQLISYVRNNCLCCKDHPHCPAYPTDLVIGLDMSEDVTPPGFQRMRSVVLTLLENINIAESNCPTGARVAVVSYSSHTKYLIRFADYHRKKQLIEAVKNIGLERTSNRRNIGSAMRFVARNVLKRVRKATLMRKVAIFLSAGESQDSTSLTTAVLEYKALNIKLGVIGLRNIPSIRTAFEADETQSFIFTVLGRLPEQNVSLSKIQNCVICYDPCRPAKECEGTNLVAESQEVELDLAVIVDGSRSILGDQYEGVKEVIGNVLDQIVVSNEPSRADGKARVALYQQSSTYSEAQAGVKVIFNFQQFRDRSLMKRSIQRELKQTGGSSMLGLAMEYAIMRGVLKAPNGRKNKMVLVVVGEETAYKDRKKLELISKMAKCKGVVLFTVTVGDQFNSTEVEELASFPLDQHLIHLGHLKHGEQEYTLRFLRTFFHILSKNVNSYPPPSFQGQCNNLDTLQGSSLDYEAAERVPFPATEYPKEDTDESSGYEDFLRDAEYTGSMFFKSSPITTVSPAIRSRSSRCDLRRDDGTPCAEYVQRWYYDGVTEACSPFWYGGCEGNENRFDSEKECLQICGKHELEPVLQEKEGMALLDDACFMKQEVGPCSTYVLRWYYDVQQNECIQFWFGGCEGNRNRFDTQKQCEAICVRHI